MPCLWPECGDAWTHFPWGRPSLDSDSQTCISSFMPSLATSTMVTWVWKQHFPPLEAYFLPPTFPILFGLQMQLSLVLLWALHRPLWHASLGHKQGQRCRVGGSPWQTKLPDPEAWLGSGSQPCPFHGQCQALWHLVLGHAQLWGPCFPGWHSSTLQSPGFPRSGWTGVPEDAETCLPGMVLWNLPWVCLSWPRNS